MKLVQPLNDIRRHYDDIARDAARGQHGADLLSDWGIDVNNAEQMAQIAREHEALRYLTSCNLMLVKDRDAIKPDMVDLESAFNRHLAFLSDIMNCHQGNWRKEPNKLVKREYEACRHYLFQLSLPAWVESLPERIQTFENKYPNYDYENNRHR